MKILCVPRILPQYLHLESNSPLKLSREPHRLVSCQPMIQKEADGLSEYTLSAQSLPSCILSFSLSLSTNRSRQCLSRSLNLFSHLRCSRPGAQPLSMAAQCLCPTQKGARKHRREINQKLKKIKLKIKTRGLHIPATGARQGTFRTFRERRMQKKR